MIFQAANAETEHLIRIKKIAASGINNGSINSDLYRALCSHYFAYSGMLMALTRDDITMLQLKDTEYVRCYHAAISFCENKIGNFVPFKHKQAWHFFKSLFPNDYEKVWIEPPVSKDGHRLDIFHYRIFCDPQWQPIILPSAGNRKWINKNQYIEEMLKGIKL